MKKVILFLLLCMCFIVPVAHAEYPSKDNSVEIEVNYDLDTNIGTWRPIVVDKEKIKFINVKVSYHKTLNPYSYQKVPNGGIIFALDDSMPRDVMVFIQTNLNTLKINSSGYYVVRTQTKRDGKKWKFVGLEWNNIG